MKIFVIAATIGMLGLACATEGQTQLETATPAVSAVESYARACATLSRTAEAQPLADQVAYFLSEWQSLTPPPGVDSYHAAILGVYRAIHLGHDPDTSALKDAYLSLHPDVQVALYDLGCIAQPPV